MKKIVLAFFFLVTSLMFSQIVSPVKWKGEIKELKEGEYQANYTATIAEPWHLYSKDLSPDSGIPTEITFEENKNLELIGKIKEVGKLKEVYSEVFETNLKYYSKKVVYTQKFKLKENKKTKISANFYYQVCNDEQCLAPESEIVELNIVPKEKEPKKIDDKDKKGDKDSVIISSDIKKEIQHDSLKGDTLQNAVVLDSATKKEDKKALIISSIDIEKPIKNCGEKESSQSERNYLKLFILGFLGGIIALLTPCVFPMIPLTISYFTKSNNKKSALIYAFLILVIFTLLSVPFHLFESVNSDIFNQISTNIWLNVFFFVVFIFFALSFFGYYEITLPSWVLNKSDKASDATSFVGLFFMALTLVVVSFSCTGPILGSVLAGALSTTGGAWQLTYALLGFGLSWGIVFGFFALFPHYLADLPKSGGWMTTFKVVLGFLELALALKFLSKADLVAKTNFIYREIFIGIWILVFAALAMYLFGLIKFPHDDKNGKIGITRKLIGFLVLCFSGYLIWGIFPSETVRLKSLSGILPPAHLSIYKSSEESCPLGLSCVHNYEDALKLSKELEKPILLDFTGYGCENCRKMEEFVWSEPDVYKLLSEQYVIASLYVDDKEELPKSEQVIVTLKNGKKRKLKTIGDKWSVFQKENFNSNSQPQYVIINSNQEVVNYPISGVKSKEEFLQFLECGTEN